MDPRTTLREIATLLYDASATERASPEREDLAARLRDLAHWIDRGGFLPAPDEIRADFNYAWAEIPA